MKSLPVHARRLPMAAAVAVAVVLTGAGVSLAAPSQLEEKVQVVHVHAPTAAERSKVNNLGLDTTEHGDATGVEVVLHSAADAQQLRAAGFTWRVEDADLAATMRKARAADQAYAASVAASGLPSGRTSYRTLDEINAELDQLAAEHPQLVKPLTLANKSVEGRSVRGIEITTNAANVHDGKPVMLLMGAHHAREWPSVEHAMEWAHELLDGAASDARTQNIVANARTIIVPVVNVDGFQISRSASPLGDFSLFDYEMKRKNCTISAATPTKYRQRPCDDNLAGRLRGTDPNRNYPGFWGGNGASTNWSSDTYRGDGPGDTPEVDNIKRLISERQVTSLISNHTYSNLVLRPPSLLSTGYAPDEPQYKALGASMTAANDYANWASFQLYDTSGSTEDWSYWQTGGYGFTFEIGPDGFHPEYQNAVVAEYLGQEPAAGAGQGGNREAYFRLAEATVDKAFHATITGVTTDDRVLTVSKQFQAMTSPVNQPDGSVADPIPYENSLSSSLRTTGGKFTWAVNPSTRPVVAGRWGRDPAADPQPTQPLTNPAGIPGTFGSEYATFTIEGLPKYDNFKAEVRVQWPDPAVDWDIRVYNSDDVLVASAETLADPEVALLIEPIPGEYTVELINYEGGETSDWTGEVRFGGPDPAGYTGLKEAWTLTCSTTGGDVISQRSVVVDRGQTVDVGNACRKVKG
jgi:murein tripeptide amidase MpaA